LLATFPSAVAICFGLGNGQCSAAGHIVLAIPVLFALFLLVADFVATIARGTPRFTMPQFSHLYRIAVFGLPIVCFVAARAFAPPVVPELCFP